MKGVDLRAAGTRLTGQSDVAEGIRAFSEAAVARILKNKGTALVVFRSAEYAVADALSTGAIPSVALRLWCDDITQLMTLQRKNSRYMVLIDDRSLLQAPEAGLKDMFERLQGAATSPAMSVLPAPDPLHMVFALHILGASSEAGALDAELAGCSLVPPKLGLTAEATDAAFQATQAGLAAQTEQLAAAEQALADQKKAHQKAQAEATAALDAASRDLAAAQQDLARRWETEAQRAFVLSATRSEAKAQQKVIEADRTARQAQIQNLQAKIAALTDQLAAAGQSLAEQKKAHQKALNVATTRGAVLAGSLDQKLSGLRLISDEQGKTLAAAQIKIETGLKSQAALEKARVSLLEQLAATETRNMTYFTRIRNQDKDLAAAHRKLAATGETLRQAIAGNVALTDRLATLEAERTKILSSHSWNVTKPLRAAHKILGTPTGKER